jgi:hypothetical protein
MITAAEVLDIVYKILVDSSLKNEVTGGIYKLARPVGSEKEDVVTSSLPINTEEWQQCTINVNIYAPNINVNINGKVQQMPDTARLTELAAMAVAILKNNASDSYMIWLSNQSIIQDETNSYFINNRLELRAINTN